MGTKITVTNHGPEDLRIARRTENEPAVFLVRLPPATPVEYELPNNTSLVVRPQTIPAAEVENRIDQLVNEALTED